MIRIDEQSVARTYLEDPKNNTNARRDFTCLFRAYGYAEAHLKTHQEIIQGSEFVFEPEIFTKKVNQKIPEKIEERTFLGFMVIMLMQKFLCLYVKMPIKMAIIPLV